MLCVPALADRDAALAWIIRKQLGRQNLSRIAHKELLGRKYEVRKRQGARTDLTSPHFGEKLTTAESIAAEEGVSKNTVERASELLQDMDTIAEEHAAARQTLDNAAKYALAVNTLEDLAPSFRAEALGALPAPQAYQHNA